MMARQFGPYVLIASLCAGLNIAILVVLDRAGLHYAFSTAISFLVCVGVGYALHCRWTFRTEPRLQLLARYAVAMSANYPLSVATIWLFYSVAELPMILAAPLSTATGVALNFVLSRWAILQPAGGQK